MASTSNGGQIRQHGVNAMLDNPTFDLDPGLADTALSRNGLQLYENLEVPEGSDPPSPSTVDASRTSPTDLFQILENEEWGSADSVSMELLNLDDQERADLLVIYPKAKIEGNFITAFHYIVFVKKFLADLMVSQNGIVEIRHPKAHARLLRRLSRELRSVPTFESENLSDKFSDPADYDGCLGELLKDMEESIKTPEPWGPDGYVYVHRGIDTYVDSLLAAATELNSSLRYMGS